MNIAPIDVPPILSSAAIFVVRHADAEGVLEELRGFGESVIAGHVQARQDAGALAVDLDNNHAHAPAAPLDSLYIHLWLPSPAARARQGMTKTEFDAD